VAERMNKTLLEKVRCLIFTSGMSKSFWGKDLSTTSHLVNRSPLTVLNFKCPEEIWTGKKVTLNT